MSMIYFNEIEELIDSYKYGDYEESESAEAEFKASYREDINIAIKFGNISHDGEAPFRFAKICKENVSDICESLWTGLYEGGADDYSDKFTEEDVINCKTVKDLKSLLKNIEEMEGWFKVTGGYFVEWL